MSDSVPAKMGGHTTVELRSKPCAYGVYASERSSSAEPGKIAQGQSWSPTGLARCDRPG
jgi:hypothetical protein